VAQRCSDRGFIETGFRGTILTDLRDIFFEELLIQAKADVNIILLTADMGAAGVSLFKQELPNQFFNVGISEQK
jgi:transketolase C-terminal domain/subunit